MIPVKGIICFFLSLLNNHELPFKKAIYPIFSGYIYRGKDQLEDHLQNKAMAKTKRPEKEK